MPIAATDFMPEGDPRTFESICWTKPNPYFIPRDEMPPITAEHVEAFRRVQDAIVKERLAAREKLTEEQIIEAFRQALACGDFTQLCVVNSDKQGVVYVPYREHARLRARIRELEDKFAKIGELLKEEPNVQS